MRIGIVECRNAALLAATLPVRDIPRAGANAASRAMKSSGFTMTAVVPSLQDRRSEYVSRSSGTRSTRSLGDRMGLVRCHERMVSVPRVMARVRSPWAIASGWSDSPESSSCSSDLVTPESDGVLRVKRHVRWGADDVETRGLVNVGGAQVILVPTGGERDGKLVFLEMASVLQPSPRELRPSLERARRRRFRGKMSWSAAGPLQGRDGRCRPSARRTIQAAHQYQLPRRGDRPLFQAP